MKINNVYYAELLKCFVGDNLMFYNHCFMILPLGDIKLWTHKMNTFAEIVFKGFKLVTVLQYRTRAK